MKQPGSKLPAAAEQALSQATEDKDLTPQQKAAKTRAANKAAADKKVADARAAEMKKEVPVETVPKEDTVPERLRGQQEDDIPTLEVDDEPEFDIVEAKSPWVSVHELSDDDMQIEGSNIFGYQFRMCLLRVRLKGELTGQVIPLERTIYHSTKVYQQNM